MKNFSILPVALFILALAHAASALDLPLSQTNSGSIRGVVTDPAGAVVGGADIQAVNAQTGEKFDTRSNNEGAFEFVAIPFGDYSITVTAPGFLKYQVLQVALGRNSTDTAHDAVMQLALGELRIDVKLADAGSTTTMCIVCGYTYFSINYADLPFVRRDTERLIALQSGVAEHKGSFSITGRRTENKTVLLDGLDNRDPATGQFLVRLGLDSLQEFNSDYTNADSNLSSGYGQTSAPQLSALSRAGTNVYHGQGFWNLQRTGMSANNFFTNRGSLPPDQAMYDEAGFTFGGNISLPGVFSGTDRAFFLISYDHTRDRSATGRQIVAPLAAFLERTSAIQGSLFRSLLSQGRVAVSAGKSGGLRDIDNDGLADIGDAAVRNHMALAERLAFARADFILTDRLQLNMRYDRDQSHRLDDFTESIFTPASPLDLSRKSELLGLNLVAVINPRDVNDFRAGYRRGRTSLAGAGSDGPQVIALNTPIGAGSGLPELPESRTDRALMFANTFTHAANVHMLSASAQVIRRNDFYATRGLVRGRIYYADALALISDGRFSAGDADRSIVRAEIAESPEYERYRLTDLYAFATDKWNVSPRFIINFGTGYNIYSGAVYEQRTDRNNFAPFVSFAYAPTESENIILRGGASIIYVPPTLLPYGEIKATPFYPVATGFAGIAELVGSPLPSDWAQAQGAIEIEREFSSPFRTAYTQSAFFAVQHSFGSRAIFEAGYHSTLGRRLASVYHNNRARFDSTSETDGEEKILIASDGNSSYHSLQLKLTSRERRGLVFQGHYTFSKAIDTASDDRPNMFRSLALGPVYENSLALERGVSDYDRRHRAVGFFLWRGPSLDGWNRSVRWMMGNWLLSGIVTVQSGARVSLYSSGDFFGGRGDFNRDGVLNDRLTYTGAGAITHAIRRNVSAADGYFDASLFGAPGVNGRIALGRNVLPAPGYGSIDLSVKKRFLLSDQHRLELRMDIFNVTNRVNFAPPVTDLASEAFGRSVEAHQSRIMRLMLKYSF